MRSVVAFSLFRRFLTLCRGTGLWAAALETYVSSSACVSVVCQQRPCTDWNKHFPKSSLLHLVDVPPSLSAKTIEKVLINSTCKRLGYIHDSMGVHGSSPWPRVPLDFSHLCTGFGSGNVAVDRGCHAHRDERLVGPRRTILSGCLTQDIRCRKVTSCPPNISKNDYGWIEKSQRMQQGRHTHRPSSQPGTEFVDTCIPHKRRCYLHPSRC